MFEFASSRQSCKKKAPRLSMNSKQDMINIPVGKAGYYSEFLVGNQNKSKAYIKTGFASNKIYFSEIDKAKERFQDTMETIVLVDTPIVDTTKPFRTRITIAELLNPEQ